MDKPIFTKKKESPSLYKIVAALLAVLMLAYGGLYAYRMYEGSASRQIAEAAPSTVTEAAGLIEQGEYAAAREALTPMIEHIEHPALGSKALGLLAKVEQETGNIPQAREYYRRAATEFPEHADQPVAQVAYARFLEEQGDLSEAERLYEAVRSSAPPQMRAPALTGLGRLMEAKGNDEEALGLYRQAVDDAAWDSDAWKEALDHLGILNVKLIFSPSPTSESDVYVVESGDNLTEIGKKLNTTQGLLTRANGLDADSVLRVGDRLKVTRKDFRIVIERSTNRLFLFDGNGLFKRYHVGLGRIDHETALGDYRIGNKQTNPDWFKPGEGRIPFGDPRNELGTRWMPLVPEAEELPRDLGIHGTFEPESVGTFSSSGCARLLNEEVEELYDLVVRATPVDIVDVIDPEDIG